MIEPRQGTIDDQPDPADRRHRPPPRWMGQDRPEDGLRSWAAFLRRYHDAVAGYRPPAGWLRYPQPPDRRRRIKIFCDAYGIPVPGDIAGRVAWQQRLVLQHCQALAGQGIEPQATWVREGYLDTIRARINWTESLHPLRYER